MEENNGSEKKPKKPVVRRKKAVAKPAAEQQEVGASHHEMPESSVSHKVQHNDDHQPMHHAVQEPQNYHHESSASLYQQEQSGDQYSDRPRNNQQQRSHGHSKNNQQRNSNRHQGQSQRGERNERGDRNNDRGERGERHERQDGGNQHNQNSNQKKFDYVAPKELTREQMIDLSLQELNSIARRWGIVGASLLSHREIIERILEFQKNPDMAVQVEGVLERLPDGFGFLRSQKFDYVSSPDDIYVSPSQIRRFGLRTGDTVAGVIRKPKENEKYFALQQVDKVNFGDPLKLNERPFFDRLSPMHPNKKFNLESDPRFISTRIMDIFTPVGKGQRGLLVAPPRVGKTVLLKEMIQSIIANHPEVFVIVLLIDERPEEVADMKRCVKGGHAEVVSSTFDEATERHVQVAELVLEKAKRLVECGKDVVIFLDSITRLARAYNTTAPASGKVLTGGVDANALQRPKRFFGAARNTEEGGSLTIIASALVETGSRMDEVIFEEFKGTGNMEMHMSRKLANRRVYPAFDLLLSGTRCEDLLLNEEELKRAWVLQKFLSNMNLIEGMEFLIDKMRKSKTNEEFFESMNAKKGAMAGNGNGNGNGGHQG